MTRVRWDQVGERRFETGVDQGVLYKPTNGVYNNGFPWNGLTTVTESPSGAESNKQYADNIVYLNLVSAEEFGGTIEAFTYPDEFAECDGSVSVTPGVMIGQQGRKPFGLSYRTKIGTDVDADAGYKYHLVYGAQASPSEKAYATVNDSPEALAFSWEFTTSPVAVSGHKPTAILTIDSTQVDADALSSLLDILYGTEGSDPRLPLPDEVFGLFSGTVTEVSPTQPTYDAASHTVTVPTVAGVTYRRTDNNNVVTDPIVLTNGQKLVIAAQPTTGYTFPSNVDTDWQYTY